MVNGIEKAQIDWQQLVLNLRKYHSLRKLGEMLEIDYQNLSRISRGETREPKFSDGLLLLDIHSDLCGCDATKRLKVS